MTDDPLPRGPDPVRVVERRFDPPDGRIDVRPVAPLQLDPPPAEAQTREQRRSRRVHPVRAVTESMKRITKRRLKLLADEVAGVDTSGRPRSRADCENGPRPCPWSGCRYNLALDVAASSYTIKLNFPHLANADMKNTCVLDVADQGGLSASTVGQLMNLTRERVRQIEQEALEKLRTNTPPALLADLCALWGADQRADGVTQS